MEEEGQRLGEVSPAGAIEQAPDTAEPVLALSFRALEKLTFHLPSRNDMHAQEFFPPDEHTGTLVWVRVKVLRGFGLSLFRSVGWAAALANRASFAELVGEAEIEEHGNN